MEQCLEKFRPLAISKEEAAEIRAEIDFEQQKETISIKESTRSIHTALSILDEKLRKLTRRLMDEIVDEDMYRATKEDFLTEKAALTSEMNRLKKNGCNYWIEPSQTLISTLETLGTMPDTASLQEFANNVRKIGTNPLLANKTVNFSFSENYDFIPSLLASARVASRNLSSKRCGDFPQNSQSSKWCAGQDLNLQPSDPKSEALSN